MIATLTFEAAIAEAKLRRRSWIVQSEMPDRSRILCQAFFGSFKCRALLLVPNTYSFLLRCFLASSTFNSLTPRAIVCAVPFFVSGIVQRAFKKSTSAHFIEATFDFRAPVN